MFNIYRGFEVRGHLTLIYRNHDALATLSRAFMLDSCCWNPSSDRWRSASNRLSCTTLRTRDLQAGFGVEVMAASWELAASKPEAISCTRAISKEVSWSLHWVCFNLCKDIFSDPLMTAAVHLSADLLILLLNLLLRFSGHVQRPFESCYLQL